MKKTERVPARQRLLEAATRVFARDGLAGATTRAIAREAGVNEVTLFRHFGSKDRLVAEVVGRAFPEGAPGPAEIPSSGDLRADLAAYARLYARRLEDNFGLVRTLIGEIHHHHASHEREVFRGIFRPLKDALVARLCAAQDAGLLRRSPDAVLLGDLLNGMIFTDTIRRSSPHARPEYSFDVAVSAAVDVVLRGAGKGAWAR